MFRLSSETNSHQKPLSAPSWTTIVIPRDIGAMILLQKKNSGCETFDENRRPYVDTEKSRSLDSLEYSQSLHDFSVVSNRPTQDLTPCSDQDEGGQGVPPDCPNASSNTDYSPEVSNAVEVVGTGADPANKAAASNNPNIQCTYQRRKQIDKSVGLRLRPPKQLLGDGGKSIYENAENAGLADKEVVTEVPIADGLGKEQTTSEQEQESASQGESLRRSVRTRYPIKRFADYDNFSVSYRAFATNIEEPFSYAEAAKDDRWCQAMNEEIVAMHQNGSWTVVPRPRDRNVVGSKWIYKIKYKADGSIDRFKARLVARGFTQEHGIEYEESAKIFHRSCATNHSVWSPKKKENRKSMAIPYLFPR